MISRHPVEIGLARQRREVYLESTRTMLTAAQERPQALVSLTGNGVALASLDAVLGGDPVRWFRLAARACAALFSLARSQGKPLSFPLDGDALVSLSGVPHESMLHAGRWLSGWLCAAAAGEAGALALLSHTPAQLIDASSSQAAAPYVRPISDALRQLATGGDPSAPLMSALRATDPASLPESNVDHALDIETPFIEVLFAVHDGEAPPFAKALELHHKFYSAPSRKDDPDGFVSRRLSAAAALAAQRGLPAGVESDYLVVAAAPETLICCPYCLVPLPGDAPICAACLNDPRNDAPVETSPQERIARVRPCPKCATPMPDLAVICATCRTRR